MANKLPDMGKMVGPLPLGVWVVLVGGGVGFMIYNRRTANADVETAADDVQMEDTGTTPGVGTGGSGLWTDITTPTTGADDDADSKPTDNDEWGSQAIDWLIGQGYNPAVADAAIRKYLSGDATYSMQEYTLVKLAIGHIGSTPTILPPPTLPAPSIPVTKPGGATTKPPTKVPVKKPPTKAPAKPKPKPAPKKPKFRYYTVKAGDNLSRIANRYYGSAAKYKTIYNANKKGHKRVDGKNGMISNANLIRPGWVLLIP